jgi:hypothetical protein
VPSLPRADPCQVFPVLLDLTFKHYTQKHKSCVNFLLRDSRVLKTVFDDDQKRRNDVKKKNDVSHHKNDTQKEN